MASLHLRGLVMEHRSSCRPSSPLVVARNALATGHGFGGAARNCPWALEPECSQIPAEQVAGERDVALERELEPTPELRGQRRPFHRLSVQLSDGPNELTPGAIAYHLRQQPPNDAAWSLRVHR